MHSSSQAKGGSAMGHHNKLQYVPGGGKPHPQYYASGQQQHQGPAHQTDGRIPKKAGATQKHKMHGMNQSMDAGIGADRFQPSSLALVQGYAGLKGARGDRQGLLAADQQHQLARQQQQRQHQNYMNASFEPTQQQALTVSHESQGRGAPPDYQQNQMHTMAHQQHGKAVRQKNQSIDVTGSHPIHYQQYAGAGQPHVAEHHLATAGPSGQIVHQQDSLLAGSIQQHPQPPGHHQHQMSLQLNSQTMFSLAEERQLRDQEYQRKKRRHNLSQSIQKRGADPHGASNSGTGSRGNTGQSKQESNMSVQQYSIAASGQQQKGGKNQGKSQHSGSIGAMATAGAADQARVPANKASMRLNSKFDHNIGNSAGASYGALGNLAGLADGKGGSFDKAPPQILSNQQIAYGAVPSQQPPQRESSQHQHAGDSQRYYSVGSSGQSHTLGSTKQSAKMKNKMNNYLLKQQQQPNSGQPKNSQSQDRFQSTQIVTKKSAKVQGTKGGSIVLPANNTVQIVPQLRQQLSQSKNSNPQKNFANAGKSSGTQSHHRMYSDDTSHFGGSMQKGFNSASNAAIQQQQAQIVQIYQQHNQIGNSAYNSAGSTGKLKYHSNHLNNSRKVIPMLQPGQPGSAGGQSQPQNVRNSSHSNQYSRDRDLQEGVARGPGHSQSQSQQFMTQPSTQKPSSNQFNISMQRKINQQADTSRVNRLHARGGEMNSQGVVLPINDVGSLSFSHLQNQLDFSSHHQGSSGPSHHPMASSQQNVAAPQRDRFAPHHHQQMNQHQQISQMSAAQKKELAIMNQYKPQLTQSMKQNTMSSGSYGKGGNGVGAGGGPGSSHLAGHDQSQKYNQPQMLLLHQSKQASASAATNATAVGAGVGSASGSYKSQAHIRQASLQIGPGGAAVGDMTSSTQKMAANHRKNKSMLNNQVRANQNLQNQQQRILNSEQQANQIRMNHGASENTQQYGVKRVNHYNGNYGDANGLNERAPPTQTNFYLQFGENTDGGAPDSAQADSSKSLSKKAQHLKQNFSQSSHRKNKTTMIGYSPQKIIGVNSSTGFHHMSGGLHSNLDKSKHASGHGGAAGGKKVGGTLSHSQKSLRSTSSQRKRVSSVDPGPASNQYRMQSESHHHNDSGSHRYSSNYEKHKYVREHTQPTTQPHAMSSGVLSAYAKMSGGNRSPGDFSSGAHQQMADRRASIHQQKAQKILKNQASQVQKQRLKPQGNIVIQQEPSQRSGGNYNQAEAKNGNQGAKGAVHVKAAGSRRHQSILKGDLQNQDMILIGEQDYRGTTQQQPQQVSHQRKSGRSQSPRQSKYAHPAHIDYSVHMDQDSAGSVSSLKAAPILDGGTGGGNTKDADLTHGSSQAGRAHERHNSAMMISNGADSSYIDRKTQQIYKASKAKGWDSSSSQREGSIQKNLNMKQRHQSKGQREPGHPQQQSKQQLEQYQQHQQNSQLGTQPEAENVPVDFGELTVPQASESLDFKSNLKRSQIQQIQQAKQAYKAKLAMTAMNSVNITQEALAIGKIPIEKIAEQIYSRKLTKESNSSPRTKEIIELSNAIKKSFQQRNEAPKTTSQFYRAGKMLGRGAFGKVCLGMHKLSRKLVALKSINKEFMNDEKQKSKVMHEVGILLRLRHQSVVQLYETFETKRHMILAMELCAGGDLLNYVRKRKKLEESEAKVLFKQIIQGLGHIHKRRILHRDIKLDNILLDGKGRVKIADFGVSKLVKPGDVMHEQSGTPAYIAPEILKEEGYAGFRADIWSAGVVFFAMLCGTVPFKASNMKELHKMIIKGKYNLKEEISPEAKHLLRSMLETDPSKRISIKKILEHPWIQSVDMELDVFSPEEKEIVKKEFIYNNPKVPNRSEKINHEVEPWDCFTELNLDSINQTLRNESEKSVILAPFNSSYSNFDEEEFKGMEASLIIHRHFDDQAALEDKKQMIRFAARCRDQDRQYEINNNGELDNGVYHKFVYSSRDGAPDQSSSRAESRSSGNDLRPHSSRNFKNRSDRSRKVFGKAEQSESDLDNQSFGNQFFAADEDQHFDEARIKCITHLGYPPEYVRSCLQRNEASYCLAGYSLLGEDQQY